MKLTPTVHNQILLWSTKIYGYCYHFKVILKSVGNKMLLTRVEIDVVDPWVDDAEWTVSVNNLKCRDDIWNGQFDGTKTICRSSVVWNYLRQWRRGQWFCDDNITKKRDKGVKKYPKLKTIWYGHVRVGCKTHAFTAWLYDVNKYALKY